MSTRLGQQRVGGKLEGDSPSGRPVRSWGNNTKVGAKEVGSTADRLLELRVRIPPEAWMYVCCVVCCPIEVSATRRLLVQRSSTDCGVFLCVIVKPQK